MKNSREVDEMDRVAFVMHVKEGEEEEYIRRHKAVWPEILADMEEAGVQQMNIFMQGQQLFLYMEVENYIAASRLLAERPDSVRWEEFMAPIMKDADGESYDPTNPYPESLPEVFYWRKGQDG
jgi:L-rhamnose mutarotase